MRRMTGGQVVVQALEAAGVEVVFGIMGLHTMHLYDALYGHPSIRQVTARHEQGAVFMADGYARASGRAGVVLLITGPGGTNVATGVAQAYADSSRLLIIQSNIDSRLPAGPLGTLHEMKDQSAFFESITQRSLRIQQVEQIPEALISAVEQLHTARPRPIHIEIPTNLLSQEADVASPARPPRLAERPPAHEANIREAVELLGRAQRPVLYAGGGVISSGACETLQRLAEVLQAPVITSTQGRGAIPDDHPLGMGNAWSRNVPLEALAREAELVLAVGTQLSHSNTGGGRLPLPANLVQIDVEATAFGRFYSPTVALCGDARVVIGQLLARLEGVQIPDRSHWLARVATLREEMAGRLGKVVPRVSQLLTILRRSLPRDAILVNDMTIACYWLQRFWPVYHPRTFLYPFYFGTLGFSLPAAVGAKLAHPERAVVGLCGDGGFLFTCQELATAVQEGIDLPIIVFNDDGFGILRMAQERTLNGRTIGVDSTNPDFIKLAKSFGANVCRLTDVTELGEALSASLETGGTWLIEVPVRLPWPGKLAQDSRA